MATIVAGKDAYMTFSTLLLTGTAAAEVSMDIKAGELDAPTLGMNWKDFIQGQSEATFDVSGVWDAGTAATRLDAVLFGASNAGGTKLTEFCPQGSATNQIKYQCNGFATGYKISAPVAGVVGFTLPIRAAGSVTRSILA